MALRRCLPRLPRRCLSTAAAERVDVCVVGGGVVGCSVAYHAAEHSSVLLLEQGAIGGGTTWHAAGLVRQARATKSETLRTGVYARQLYRELEELTGLSTGFRATGNVGLARTPGRRVEMRRQMSRMRSYGIHVEEVSVEEGVARLSGVVSPEGYCGAFWTPQDGQVDPSNVAAALTKGARMRGAEIRERQRVARIVPDGDGWRIGLADGQEVLASQVVNAAGQWARKLGQLSGVDVPLHSNEHFYIVARPTAGIVVPPDLPTFRDPDGCFYGRGWSGGLLVGWFEQHCKTAFVEGPPDDFEFSLLEDDWEHLEPHLLDIFERIPGLENAQLDQVNGPESFTYDNSMFVGEAPGKRGYFVAAGMCSSGIAASGGVGWQVARWLREGKSPVITTGTDLLRVPKFVTQSYCRDKALEVLHDHYTLHLPKREAEHVRGVRRSPLYAQLAEHSASFGSKAGWERPNFFDTPRGEDMQLWSEGDEPPQVGWDAAAWMEHQCAEHLACREGAVVFDTSSFAKTLVVGSGAERALSWVCANEIRGREGLCTYTHMLDEAGGVRGDVTVRQVGAMEWLVLSPTADGPRDMDWIERHLPADCRDSTHMVDVTSQFCVLAVMGPRSAAALSAASSWSAEQWLATKRGSAATVEIGWAQATAVRTSFVGEACGWEIICDADVAPHVYETLRGSGDVEDAGYFAIDSLRVEKGRSALGHELDADVSPFDAGLGFAVKMEKDGGFLGQAALRTRPEGKRLCVLTAPALSLEQLQGRALWGGEPLVEGGEYTGEAVTSAALVPVRDADGTVRRLVSTGLGYLEDPEQGASVEVAGERWELAARLA